MDTTAKALIEALLDKGEEIGGRDDAAIDLRYYDDPLVLETLCKIASDPEEDEMLHSTCGESAADIWIRKKNIDVKMISSFCGIAKDESIAYIKKITPSLYCNTDWGMLKNDDEVDHLI